MPALSSDARIDDIHHRFAIQDAVHALFLATDARAWDRVREIFADEVHFDMTSLAGGEPGVLTSERITNAWAEGLAPVKAVHHQVGNMIVRIEDDSATVHCYGTATHYRPDQEKRITTFVGSYD